MIKSFFCNKNWLLWAWGGLFVLLSSLWAQVSLTVAINEWYGGFYDLMQNSASYFEKPQIGIDLFYDELLEFTMLAMPYVVMLLLQIGLPEFIV